MSDEKMQNASHTAGNNLRDLYAKLKPPHKQSKFYSDGILTPDEFIKAGDFLVSKCPTWKWCKADKEFINKYLPEDKQYLKTTVPCYKRAVDYLSKMANKETLLEGDWIDTDFENADLKENEKKEEKKRGKKGGKKGGKSKK